MSKENSRKSGKRRRYVSNSEDNISLYASDELEDADIDDIKMLTERSKSSKATGRNERETTANERKLLQDFANSLDEDDATGNKIQQVLADIALKRWGKKLSFEKIKSLIENTNSLITALK